MEDVHTMEEGKIKEGQVVSSSGRNNNNNNNNNSIGHSACAKEEIPKRRGGGKWPSLADECEYMLSSAVLVYALVELRNYVRAGKCEDQEIAKALLELPLKSHVLLPLIEKRQDFFAQFVEGMPKADEKNEETRYPYFELLLAEVKKQENLSRQTGDDNQVAADMELVQVHDEKTSEIVYSVQINQ